MNINENIKILKDEIRKIESGLRELSSISMEAVTETLQRQITERKDKLAQLEEQLKADGIYCPLWRAETSQRYWKIYNDGRVRQTRTHNSDDVRNWDKVIDNQSKTKEHAGKKRSAMILINDMNEFAKIENEGWFPDWESDDRKYYIYTDSEYNNMASAYYVHSRLYLKLPHFKTEQIVDDAIEKFGDRLTTLNDYL